MISRLHLSTILIAAAVISGLVLLVSGVAVKIEWLTSMSATITSMSLLLLAFQHWAWKWRWLHGWFVEKPNLNGTWRVSLNSNWQDPATGEVVPEKTGYLVVRQTYSHLSLRLMTDESSSELVGSSVHRAEDGVYRISGVYRNEPQLAVRDRSPIHYGAILLDVEGDPATGLVGQYWTDRNSAGELQGRLRVDEQHGSFAEADKAFETTKHGGHAASGSVEPEATAETEAGASPKSAEAPTEEA